MGLVRDIIENFRNKAGKDAEWNAYWKQVKEDNIISNLKTIKNKERE